LGQRKERKRGTIIKDIEEKIEEACSSNLEGFPSESTKEEFLTLEKHKRQILEDREATWRLNSRALCLESEDENIKFFQAYAKGRKNSNTIWSLQD